MSAPEIFLTAVAAKTSRIRIGHGGVCMPFGYNHPVRVAERAAMLDIISDGRLDLGAARGGTVQEMSLCGVDPEITARAGRGGAALHRPLLARRDDRVGLRAADDPAAARRPPHTVVPRPVQMPHPPLFLACTNPETVRLAARYGVGPMVLGFGGPEAIGAMRADVRRRARADAIPTRSCRPGTSTTSSSRCARRSSWTTARRRSAVGARAQRFFAEAITHWAAPNGVAPARDTDTRRQRRVHERAPRTRRMDAVAAGRRTADRGVVAVQPRPRARRRRHRDRLRRATAGAGVDNVMCLIQMGTLTQDQQLKTIRIFGEQVIPHFPRARHGARRSSVLNELRLEHTLVDLHHHGREGHLVEELDAVGRLVVGEAIAAPRPQLVGRRR